MLKRLQSQPLIFLIGLIVCLFLADRSIAFVAQRVLLHSDFRIAQAYAGGRQDDILILGNSVANAMVLPHSLGKTVGHKAFSMAVHGLDTMAQNALVGDYLERNAAPRVALLELRPVSVDIIRANEFLIFSLGDTRMVALYDQLQESFLPWQNIFHSYRLNSPLLPITLQRLVDRDDQETGATDGRINAAMIDRWEKNSSQARPIREEQKAALLASLEAFKSVGTHPFVILAPLHPVARPQGTDMLNSVASQLPPDITVCDFSSLLDDNKYYEDPTHLNKMGRQAFTPVLAALISRDWGAPSPPARSSVVGTADYQHAERVVEESCKAKTSVSG
jgi:hypothetical protein